jgi:hypothetical protein
MWVTALSTSIAMEACTSNHTFQFDAAVAGYRYMQMYLPPG